MKNIFSQRLLHKTSKTEKKNPGICIVSSYPPRKCGIATFSSSLINNIFKIAPKVNIKIAAINDPQKSYNYSKKVITEISQKNKESYIKASEIINNDKEIDVVSLQHVFSLFGGENGEFVIDLLKNLRKPVITTMHMIYSAIDQPHYLEVVDKGYKYITEKIVSLSKKIVVIIQPMADILEAQYNAPPDKIVLIPHGVPEVRVENPEKYKKIIGFENKRVISSFGLIRPKKGLEYLIWAMPEIIQKYPNVITLILGEAHPNRPKEYYNFLKEEARKTGLLNKHIFFSGKYLKLKEIITYLLATDIFVTPYLVPDQMSSGVIAYAISCGKAVVSTPFLYAKEILNNGKGMFVNFKDSKSIFSSIDFLFSHPREKQAMEKRGYLLAKKMIWPKVAKKYLETFKQAFEKKHG